MTATAAKTRVNSHPAASATVREKFMEARRALNEAFIEREEEVDLLLTAIVARENCLFVGAPGIAKSAVQDGLLRWLDGPTFSILMHRSVGVEEILGNISLREMTERDVWRRNVKGKMPAAVLAVTDELFKSSQVSQTPMMKLLNERTYEVDGCWVKAPLASVFAASNEWPQPDDSGIDGGAFFDRFVFRKVVRPIETASGLDRLLGIAYEDDPAGLVAGPIGEPQFRLKATPEDLQAAHDEARAIRWTRQAGTTLSQIFDEIKSEGVEVSDRRKRKAAQACQAAAWLDGAANVEPEHLACLAHVLWDDPGEQIQKVAKVVAKLANPTKWAVAQHRREVEVIEDQVDYDLSGSVDQAISALANVASKLAALKDTEEVREMTAEVATTRSRILTKKARRGFRS